MLHIIYTIRRPDEPFTAYRGKWYTHCQKTITEPTYNRRGKHDIGKPAAIAGNRFSPPWLTELPEI